jgi:hypothetical protein
MKYSFVVTGLALLVLANFLIVYQVMRREGFQAMPNMPANPNVVAPPNTVANMAATMPRGNNILGGAISGATVREGFSSYLLSEAAGAKDKYQSMGAYDGIVLPTGNNVSSWRYTAPNEKLLGDEFVPGDDALFMFKNNQCKPECCGSSWSCDGGCVCTTPDQREFINTRGGNRTRPESGV